MAASFLWYDLETWGTDARFDRIAQFAAQRTDEDLNPLGPPELVWFAPARDFLPSPAAAAVTGLDPFELERIGLCEAEAMKQVAQVISQPGTCAAGWNTLRFDDEFVRHALYRNFHDPYAREWSQGNSRWDLLDYARLAYALRPDGVQWPVHEDGAPSFRLEHLAAANGVIHSAAHDARSDVEATLGMARVLRDAQPRLWKYALGFRRKQTVLDLLDLDAPQPVLHVSGMYPTQYRCARLVLPVARHPQVANQIVVADLSAEPDSWIDLDPETLAERLFTRQAELPEGSVRIPVKTLHVNRCPSLVPLGHLRDQDFERLGIDLAACLGHAERIRAVPGLAERLAKAHARSWPEAADVDAALYEALPDRRDQRLFELIRTSDASRLAEYQGRFHDYRGDELLWRYRARNYPQTLSAFERARWQQEVQARLAAEEGARSLKAFDAEMATLAAQHAVSPEVLERMQRWREAVAVPVHAGGT